MELPNYRLPTPRSVALLLWEKAKDFLQRAFTVIFVATVVVWILKSFDARLNFVAGTERAGESLLSLIGALISPVFRPLGFASGEACTSIICGFMAKEAVAGTLEMLSGGSIASLFPGALSAFSFLTFVLLYTPCIAAVSAMRKELNSRLATLSVVIAQCAVAWLVSFIVYSLGSLLL